MSLSRQVITSGFWLQVSRLIQLGSNFIVSVILARLLLPADFGLAGMVTLIGAFVAQFVMIGLTMGIVQKQDISQRQLSTLFWINLGFNLTTGLIVIGCAPLAVRFYHQPQLVPLILVYALSFLISPFFQVHRRLLEKKIYFERIARIEVAAAIGSGIIAIILALLGTGVYAIVWQTVSMNAIYLITTRMYMHWNPDFTFCFYEIKDLLLFSLKMKGARMANFFERNIDFMILSKLFSATLFGYYSLAYRVMYFPVRRITYVFSEILYPAFSRIQEEPEKIRSGYLRSMQLVAVSVLPIPVVLAVFSKPLVTLLLGAKWLPVIRILFVLSLAGFFQSLEVIGDCIYPALNRPHILLWLEIIRTVVTGLAVVSGGLLGLFAVAVAVLIARFILFAFNVLILNKMIHLRFFDLLKGLAGPLLASGLMFLVMFMIKKFITQTMFMHLLSLLIGFAVYLISLLATNRSDLGFVLSRFRQKAPEKLAI